MAGAIYVLIVPEKSQDPAFSGLPDICDGKKKERKKERRKKKN